MVRREAPCGSLLSPFVRSRGHGLVIPHREPALRCYRFENQRVSGVWICNTQAEFAFEDISQQVAAHFGSPAFTETWSVLWVRSGPVPSNPFLQIVRRSHYSCGQLQFGTTIGESQGEQFSQHWFVRAGIVVAESRWDLTLRQCHCLLNTLDDFAGATAEVGSVHVP